MKKMKQKKMKQKRMRKIGIASALGLVVLVVLGLYRASNYMLKIVRASCRERV